MTNAFGDKARLKAKEKIEALNVLYTFTTQATPGDYSNVDGSVAFTPSIYAGVFSTPLLDSDQVYAGGAKGGFGRREQGAEESESSVIYVAYLSLPAAPTSGPDIGALVLSLGMLVTDPAAKTWKIIGLEDYAADEIAAAYQVTLQ